MIETLMDNPTTAAIVLAVLGVVGEGLRRIWNALVAAVVRALDQVAPDHQGDDDELVAKVRGHAGSMLTTVAPGAVIRRELTKRRSMPPPGGTMTYTQLPAVHPDNWPALLRHGDLGVAVAAWQATLEGLGYDITDDVGRFGDSTHNATLAFQRLRAIGIDGVVGDESKSNIIAMPKARADFPAFDFDSIALVQAKNYTRASRDADTIMWIVLHSMEGAEASTKAETVSRWFADLNKRFPAPRSSAHYAVDCDSIVQMVKDDDVAWAAPGANRNGLHIEHAGKARQTAAQWRDAFSEPMLLLSAELTARKCKEFNIPVEFVDRNGLDAGIRGITTHNEVTRSNLSDRGTHTDPGKNFPMDWYLARVSDALAQL